MINRNTAESIAADLVGRPQNSTDQPWHLEEFSQGWLVRQQPPPGELLVGGANLVIERDTGQTRRFPSSVPPERITEEYPEVRDRGHEVSANS